MAHPTSRAAIRFTVRRWAGTRLPPRARIWDGTGPRLKYRPIFARHGRRQAVVRPTQPPTGTAVRSEEHTSELQSLMRISYAVFCLKKKINRHMHTKTLICPNTIANQKQTK